MKPDWQGPGDPLYLRPPKARRWSQRPMLDVMDDPTDILNETAARWPEPDPTYDLDWT